MTGEEKVFEKRVERNMAAMSRKDLAEVMRPWADDGVLEFPGHTSISGRYEGRHAIEGFFRRVFEGTETMHIAVKRVAFANPIGFTYRNAVYVEAVVDTTTKAGISLRDERIFVIEYGRGKVVSLREWALDPTLLERPWGRGPEPSRSVQEG